MQKDSSQLEDLIESLSAHEKRYIGLFITRQKKDEVEMLRLFERIAGKKVNTRVRRVQSKPSQENYLYRSILKALRSYYESKTIDITLRERLINAVLLYERRLYILSLKELETAEKIARENERWASVLEILALRAEVILEHNSVDILKKLEQVAVEINEVYAQLGILSYLKHAQIRIYAFCRINYHNRSDDKLSELQGIYSLQENKISGEQSLLETHYKLMSESAIHYFTGAFDRSLDSYMRLLTAWEKKPARIQNEKLIYKRFLSNVLSSAHASGNFQLMAQMLSRLKALPTTTVEEEAEKFQNLTYMELLYLMNTDGFSRLDKLADEIDAGLKKYKTKVNKAREIAFYHNVSMAYFLLGEWKKSLLWIDRIVAKEKTEHRRDLQHTARIIKLALQYELGKHDLMEYELVNVERFLRKRKSWFSYESTVVKFFGKIISVETDQRKALIGKFSMKLNEAVSGKTSAALPGSSELMYWAKSKLTGKSMRSLLKDEK